MWKLLNHGEDAHQNFVAGLGYLGGAERVQAEAGDVKAILVHCEVSAEKDIEAVARMENKLGV